MRAPAALTGLLLFVVASSAQAQVSRTPPSRTGAARQPSVFVHAEGGVGLPGLNVDYEATVPDNAEDTVYSLEVSQAASPVIDVGAWTRLTPRFGVGVSLSARQRNGTATLEGQSPHPFYFDQAREISGAISGLKTRETALHFELVVPVRIAGLDVAVFGGPSVLIVRHTVLAEVDYTQTYPYDTATFSGAGVEEAEGRGLGYNAGAEAHAMLTPRLGIGGRVRFVGGSTDLDAAGGPVPFKIGSVQVTAGVRLSF